MSVNTMKAGYAPSLLLPVVGLVALGAFVCLYLADPALYLKIIDLWRPRAGLHPFYDSDIGAQISCWQRGVDVYAADPCDMLGRPFGYSPFWLRLWFLPSSLKYTSILGISQAIIFLLSLAVLPPARDAKAGIVMLLALLSPATIFGVERSNPDLFMFVLAVVTVLSLEWSLPFRIGGYAAALLGGSLKFYPVVLLLLLARERVRVFMALAAIGLIAIAAFVIGFHHEFARMLPNLPRPGAFEYSLGATQFGNGIALLTASPVLAPCLSLCLTAACLTYAIRLARHPGFSAACNTLTAREAGCLLVGADLMVGCFFAGISAGYRSIHLLFALPALLALSQRASARNLRLLFSLAAISVLAVMWIRIPMSLLGPEHPAGFPYSYPAYLLFWCLRELLWWFVVTILSAYLVHFVIHSPVWQATCAGATHMWNLAAFRGRASQRAKSTA
jgi:hypothetical protein